MSQSDTIKLEIEYFALMKKVLFLKLLAIILSSAGLYFTYRFYSAYGFNQLFAERAVFTTGIPFAYMLYVKLKTDSIGERLSEIKAKLR